MILLSYNSHRRRVSFVSSSRVSQFRLLRRLLFSSFFFSKKFRIALLMAESEGVSRKPKAILYASNERRIALATCRIKNIRDGTFSTELLIGMMT